MKWIIYLLLISNIGFAAWHFRGLETGKDGSSEVLNVTNESQLILLSEFKQQKHKIKKVQSTKLCYSIGPFTQKSASTDVQRVLKAKKLETKQIRLRDTSRRGYWVILPASDSRKAALKHISKLKKLKVKDYFLVATGPFQNAVSLGVFSQKNLARRRVDEIIRYGFVPRMISAALPRNLYWLTWDKESEIQPDTITISRIKKQYPQISKIERSCK